MENRLSRLFSLWLIYTFSIVSETGGEFETKVDRYCDKFLLNNSRNCEGLTDYYLYTKAYRPVYHLTEEKDSMKMAPFTANAPIKIILHGFNGSSNTTPNTEIRPEYLLAGYNVISADYSQFVQYPCFRVAAYNVKILGECFAKFVKNMLKTKVDTRKIDRTDLHVIGHNLGAQVAGKSSEILKKNYRFRRLTALDPILPLFYDSENYVCKECADFVDVIYTNTKMHKQLKHLGHVDFYINNPLSNDSSIANPKSFASSSPRYFSQSISKDRFYHGSVLLSGNESIMGEWTPSNTRGVFGVYTSKPGTYSNSPWKKLIGVYRINNLEIDEKAGEPDQMKIKSLKELINNIMRGAYTYKSRNN